MNAAKFVSRISSSGAPSETGEGGPSHSAVVRSVDQGESTIVIPDEEMNAIDVQEDNNNDEGMMDNRVVSK